MLEQLGIAGRHDVPHRPVPVTMDLELLARKSRSAFSYRSIGSTGPPKPMPASQRPRRGDIAKTAVSDAEGDADSFEPRRRSRARPHQEKREPSAGRPRPGARTGEDERACPSNDTPAIIEPTAPSCSVHRSQGSSSLLP